MNVKRFNVLGSNYSILSGIPEAKDEVLKLIKSKKTGYICVSNVHTTVMGVKDKEFQEITNESVLSIPDGMPLVWLGKKSTGEKIGRCAGPDLMQSFFEASVTDETRHYFFGSTEEVLKMMIEKLNSDFPKIKIAGYYSPPYGEWSRVESEGIIERINDAKPDIVWVGLGAPKQEVWMKNNWEKINGILIGVGAAFDFFAGNKKRAPKWMQRFALEWLFRLLSEPRRLWKRYFVTNTLFLYYLITKKK